MSIRLARAGLGLAFLISSQLHAQDAPIKTMAKVAVAADEVVVEGYKPESSASATGLNLSLRETPQSVTVITRERIEDQAFQTVGDALKSTTGVSVKPVDRGRNNLSVRGFEVNNFQLDGAPTPTGNIGLETGDTALYERVEVVRGATGLLSGAGDPSASINLVRKHATAEEFTGQLSAALGSWDQRNLSLDLGSPLNASGSIRGRFVADWNQSDAFIDLEQTERRTFYGVIDADFGDKARLSVGISSQKDVRDGVLWASLPYWYSDGTRTNYSRSKTTATSWNDWTTEDESAFVSLQVSLPEEWSIRGEVSYHQQKEDSMLLWMWGNPDRETGEGIEAYPYHYYADPEQLRFSVIANGGYELFGRQHELSVGVTHSKSEYRWLNQDAVGAVEPVGDFDAWDGSYAEPEMTDFYVGSQGVTTETAAYLVTRLSLTDRVKFIAGARLTNWEADEEATVWAPEPFYQKESNVITPYAGMVLDVTKRVSAYASFTDSFKPQSAQAEDGSYLDPLKGNSYEVGVKSELADGKLLATAALFRIDQENYPVPTGELVRNTSTPAMRPAQGVVSEGYELEFTGEPVENLELSLGWTHFTAKDGEDVDVAVDHARELLRFFAKYQLAGSGFSFGGGVNWEGDRPATAENPATGLMEKVGQPAYALVDAMAKYDINDRVSLQLNVSNLLDEKYRSGSYWWGAPYNYGEPRKVLLSVDFGF